MINKLRVKFILLSMSALLLVLAIIIAGMNAVSYRGILSDADTALTRIAEDPYIFAPAFEIGGFQNMTPPASGSEPMDISPGSRLESRYFTVTADSETGEIIDTETSRFFSVEEETVTSYADTILNSKRTYGFVDYFRYYKEISDDTTRIIFLDCGRELDSFRRFLISSTGIALLGYLIVFAIIAYFSGRIIRPISESYEKQKRFITDAGHEIKTPLAIINADVDVLELDYGENEWLKDIQKQTTRLTELTNDLVYLAKMEEADTAMQMIAFPISDVIDEVSSSFHSLAQTQSKTFICKIQPMLTLKGDEKAIRQLASILLDNALKYSPERGTVSLTLNRQGKTINLSVYNTTASEMDPAKLPHLFDRFYRMDSSRNSQTGGHGIGLSIAQAVVNAHGGKIQAVTEDGRSLKITASLPI